MTGANVSSLDVRGQEFVQSPEKDQGDLSCSSAEFAREFELMEMLQQEQPARGSGEIAAAERSQNRRGR